MRYSDKLLQRYSVKGPSSKSSDELCIIFDWILSKFSKSSSAVYTMTSGYSHICKLPNIMIKANSFNDFNKHLQSFIKRIAHVCNYSHSTYLNIDEPN